MGFVCLCLEVECLVVFVCCFNGWCFELVCCWFMLVVKIGGMVVLCSFFCDGCRFFGDVIL